MMDKKDVAVLGMWLNNNYGAVLTYYALNWALSKLGYTQYIINHIPYSWKINSYPNGISEKFANKHFNLTEYADRPTDLLSLNDKFDTFIVGADQVFRYEFVKHFEDIYFLNFVNLNKKILSFGSSFGLERFTGSELDKGRVNYLLSRFDFLSSRELDGLRVFKEQFGLEASFMLDPVFLPPLSLYTGIMDSTDQRDTVVYYFIHGEKEKLDFANSIAQKYGLRAFNMRRPGNSIEGWLTDLFTAKYVVTDSFHCTCFSIIFNKNFYTLSNFPIEMDFRFETIKKLFPEVKDNIQQKNAAAAFFVNYEFDIQWDNVNLRKEALNNESLELMKFALDTPKCEVSLQQQGFEKLYFDLFNKLVRLDRITYNIEQRLSKYKDFISREF